MAEQQGKGVWEQRLSDVGAKVEDEVRCVITFLNDEVVPEVRRDGSRALRTAAEELVKLAERLESRQRGSGGSRPAERAEDEQ